MKSILLEGVEMNSGTAKAIRRNALIKWTQPEALKDIIPAFGTFENYYKQLKKKWKSLPWNERNLRRI